MSDENHRDLDTVRIAKELRAKLLLLFPAARTEGGQLDFDRLKLLLGEVVDEHRERYNLVWPGKSDCLRTIQVPSIATLLPIEEESVKFNTTKNLIIEGDNLEVLKLLQKAYLGQVKMIYIDPPYNTGNDFIYPDMFGESLYTYLAYTGQVDAEGRKFGTNTDADGRFHSKWLNMMYPRLYLARNLLTEDGLIFISISDHEVASLKLMLNEIFGEENFSAQIVWKSRKYPDSRAKTGVSTDHEYILLFSRSPGGALRGVERDETKFANPDNDPRGVWMSRSLLGLATRSQRPNLHYPVTDPATGHVFNPPDDTGWRYAKDRMEALIEQRCILFPAKPEGRPREKKFRADLQSEFVAFPSIIDDVFTSDGTVEIREIFGEEVFDFSKPSALIKKLIKQGSGDDAIILDFFAGSGSTGHAVLEINEEEGSNRQFILVQLPEKTERSDYSTIAEITKERLRRVIATQEAGKVTKLDLLREADRDRGFRVFKLAESNFKLWDSTQTDSPSALEQQLVLHIDHLRHDRAAPDLLYEILLRGGFPLTTDIEELTLGDHKVFAAAEGALLICLESKLTLDLIRAIAEKKPERVVCLDDGFAGNDQLKTNAVQTFKSKGIVFRTV